MEEATTIAYVRDARGSIVGRFTMQDDHDAPCVYEGPHAYFPALTEEGGVTVRVIHVNGGADPDWYETMTPSAHDGAWRRIRMGGNAEGFERYTRGDDEDVELFTRYMRVFHPLVPVIDQWVTTGYSQGDAVRLIAWADEVPTTEPAYKRASQMHDQCANALDFIGEFARGQFVTVTHEEMVVDSDEFDAGEDVLTVSVSWDGIGSVGGVHYSEEFKPTPSALNVARDMTPAGYTIDPVDI